MTDSEETLARKLSVFTGVPTGAPCHLLTADPIPPNTLDVVHHNVFNFLDGEEL